MTTHAHRWRIAEQPVDDRYPATCRDCNATRTFPRDAEWSYGEKYAPTLRRAPQEVNGIPLKFKPFGWGTEGLTLGREPRTQ